MKMKFLLFILIAVFTNSLSAQTAIQEADRFFYSPQGDTDLKVIIPEYSFSRKGIQYGATLSPIYILQESGSDSLQSYMINARLWAKSHLWTNSFFYIRGKNSYLEIIDNSGIYQPGDSKNVLDLDMAYLSMSSANGGFRLSLGRKFYNIGSGIVLNGRGDGGEIAVNTPYINFTILGLYTGLLLKDNNPYNLSDIDITDGAKRAFAGGTGNIEFINQNLYFFALAQRDRSKENSVSKTHYNSEYYGAGLEGILFENVSYFAEFIYETGKSCISDSDNIAANDKKSTISAYAVNSEINWFIPVQFNPAITLQYAFGSGDKNRNDYTSGVRPESSTGDDTGFISFGTYSGGFALKPDLSNIHIIRGGLAVAPFSWSQSSAFRKMSISGKYSHYMKDKKESVINTSEVLRNEMFLGEGVDISFRWQMFSDLSLYVNYGLFIPGDAFVTKENQNFILTGLNLSI